MTPNKLIWKELWQRPTAMITCLLAIMLGVTALVAIRSVTVYSDMAVARQMSELGANVLLLPKSATLQDYYAADTNGETLPEEYGTQLLLADVAGVEHIAPKLSVKTELEGEPITLTGILPQSEFDAQANWNGMQAFKKACGNGACAKRVVLEDGSRSAAESLAKSRYVSDMAKDEVIVGADAAEQFGLRSGKNVSLLGKSFKVTGVMPATGTVDDSRVFAHLRTVQDVAKAGQTVNVIEIMACCEDAAGGLIAELRKLFPEAKVLTITQVVDTQVAVNRLMTRLSYLFLAILTVVGMASIAGTMFANVTERRREIGTLMALGATPSLVTRLFLGKALLIGLAGGVLGYLFGTVIAVALGPSWAGVAVLPVPSLAAAAVGIAATVALLSSYLPARRAALIDPCLCFREV
jgi:putative ABC transport system permease protein